MRNSADFFLYFVKKNVIIKKKHKGALKNGKSKSNLE